MSNKKNIQDYRKKHMLESFWKNQEKKGGVKKAQTGIRGLDETLEGGVPKGRATLVTGNTGCGKTVILNEFLYRGITKFNEPGVFITFEEKPNKIINNVKNFGWNLDTFMMRKKLDFVDGSPEKVSTEVEVSKNYDPFGGLIARIEAAVKKVKAKRVAIDSLGVIFEKYSKFEDKFGIREAIYRLIDYLNKLEITTLITAEKVGNEDDLAKYGVQEFVADGVIDLFTKVGQNKILRELIIRKMRGVGYRSGRVEFEILPDGIQVYPKIPIDYSTAKTDFRIRKKFGIEKLDEALGGGIPQGHMVLLGGNTGSGKTTLGLHFLEKGIKNKENCVYVALEEPIPQIKKTALEHEWNLQEYEKQNKLKFVSVPIIDISPDQLLYKILDAVNDIGAKRVVIDSVSSLLSSTMNENKVREFLIQAAGFFKTLGITCIMNYLVSDSFGATKDQLLSGLMTNEMRLSSIVDSIIVLRYVERDQRVDKLLNILKLRGSKHSKDIFKYKIEKQGIVLENRFNI